MMSYTVIMVLFAMVIIWPIFAFGNVIHSIGDVFIPGIAFGGIAFLIWAISWRSSIRIADEALIVCNVFFVHEIPWTGVRDILQNEGIKIVLDDGEIIGSVQFGGSLLGAMTGYPTYKRPTERLKQALEEHREAGRASAGVQKRTYFSFPWVGAIGWYLFFTIPAVATFLYFKPN